MKPTVSTPRNTTIDQKPNNPILPSVTAQGNRKGHFEIEDDEQNGDEIEAHIEFAPRIVKRLEAAFIGRELLGIRTLLCDQERQADGSDADDHGNAEEDEDRQIFTEEAERGHDGFSVLTENSGTRRPGGTTDEHQTRALSKEIRSSVSGARYREN